MLLDGEEIRQHLGGMPLVRESVPHGNAAVGGQILHHLLGKTPEHDSVKHPPQDPGGVLYGFLLPKVQVVGIQVFGVAPFVVDAAHRGAVGARGTLLENEGDVLPIQQRILQVRPRFLPRLQLRRQRYQAKHLLVRQVQ